MSVWTTKTLDRVGEYIVLQHTLKGVNHSVNGIKFRNGYAVVEKDSKIYFALKKIPVLTNAKEHPLTFLTKLPFITRTQDIRTVYGQDVYIKFLEASDKEKQEIIIQEKQAKILAEQQEQERRELELKAKEQLVQKIENALQEGNADEVSKLQEAIPTISKCCYRTNDNTLCNSDAVEYSPSNYCAYHIVEEPKLSDFGVEKPNFMTKDEKRKFRDKVKSVLQKAKASRKF